MLKNYLKIAFRNLSRHKGYTFINVAGLAAGMACCLLILLYVRDELSYDRFHENAERIYRITSDWGDFSVPATNPPFVRRFETDFPEIAVTRMLPYSSLVRYEERRFREPQIFFVTPGFLETFSFPLLRGDATAALAQPFTAVITEETARRYFGSEDPVGKVLQFDNRFEVEVTGLIAPAPDNAHFHFSILASWATLDALEILNYDDAWDNNGIYTYLTMPEGYDAARLEAQIPDFIERHAGDRWNGARLSLQPLTQIHLHSHHNMELEANGNASSVYLFSAIALFILAIACINFMNLATARSAVRAKEVGIRKAAGAHRLQVAQQFLTESVVLSFIALALAFALASLALPAFRAISGKAVSLAALMDGRTATALLALTLIVGLLAGSYPAFVLSAFRPVKVLKGGRITRQKGALLRKGLVVFQFGASIVLIAGTLVVLAQLDYLRSAGMGFDKEQVLVLPVRDERMLPKYEAFRAALLENRNVTGVSSSSESLPSELLDGSGVSFEGAPADAFAPVRTVSVGHDFFEVLKVEKVAGRVFSRDFPSDSSAFVLNETALRLLLEKTPGAVASAEEAVGRQLQLRSNNGTLIGVVKDFNMSSLHEAVEPVIFFIDPNEVRNYLVRVSPERLQATVDFIRATWSQIYPEWPIEYQFADQSFDAAYRGEERLARIFSYFSGLAILIACLGLFGLATFTAEQRTKEIGIRKALGASVPGIVTLLTKDFVVLVLVGFIIACPITYFGMSKWLEDFAYRIEIGPAVFLAAGALALLIALATVSYQAVRAALSDPVKSLRYE